MKKRDFLSVTDFSVDEIWKLFELTHKLKRQARKGVFKRHLKNKIIAMIFSKTSTRTRVSFEVGIRQLGGFAIYLNKNDMQLNKGETIYDTAKVLSRYVNGVVIRTYKHEEVVEFARAADVPVINGLTDLLHPCQALADFFTIFENKSQFIHNPSSLKITFIGDGNNVASSLLLLSSMIGNQISIATPRGYEVPREIREIATENAKKSGARIVFGNDPYELARDADVLYTDVWISMGQESESEERIKVFKDYRISSELLRFAKTDVIVLHCLPANRGMEITDEVMDGPHSRIFDEAENRLHVQKALLLKLLS